MLRTPTRLLILFLAVIGSGCAWLDKYSDNTVGWDAAKLYSEASSELNSGNYATAVEYYEKLEARYPFGRYAMQAQLDVAHRAPPTRVRCARRAAQRPPRRR